MYLVTFFWARKRFMSYDLQVRKLDQNLNYCPIYPCRDFLRRWLSERWRWSTKVAAVTWDQESCREYPSTKSINSQQTHPHAPEMFKYGSNYPRSLDLKMHFILVRCPRWVFALNFYLFANKGWFVISFN